MKQFVVFKANGDIHELDYSPFPTNLEQGDYLYESTTRTWNTPSVQMRNTTMWREEREEDVPKEFRVMLLLL